MKAEKKELQELEDLAARFLSQRFHASFVKGDLLALKTLLLEQRLLERKRLSESIRVERIRVELKVLGDALRELEGSGAGRTGTDGMKGGV